MKYRIMMFILALMFIGGEANAASVVGKITSIYLSGSSNYAFRIIVNSTIPGCPGGFAYINVGDHGNYQAYVSSLTSAYLAGKTVEVVHSPGQSGYCLIQEFQVRD